MFIIFLKIILLIFRGREGGRGKEEERERNTDVRAHQSPASCTPLLGIDPATRLYALDWESKQQPFGAGDNTQPTVPHQPEQDVYLLKTLSSKTF